jgi:hypothetical protein
MQTLNNINMTKTTIPILLLLYCGFANGQQVFRNNGNLQIHSGASIVGFGDFTNASSATLLNNGNLYIHGNITNDQASMSAGSGMLYLNGSSQQTIGGTQTFKTFGLETDNSSGFLLNSNLSVAGTHTYTNGMITTSSTPNYMTYEAGSSYSGSNDARHVNGWVKKTGNTDFTFPVGNATYERSVLLTNLSASSEFNVRHNGAVTPNYTSLYNPLVIVDTSEYWTIDKVSGSAAQITMNWDASKIPFPLLMLSDIRASYWDGTFWQEIGGTGSGSVLTTGSVTSNSVSAFNSNFTIGSISFVLPLRIISFTASRENNYSRVNWAIGNELNVVSYELERSDDGISFNTISVKNPFNQNGTEFYSYADSKQINNIAYYRLKVVGIDNRIIYSGIVTVSENGSNKDLYVIKNPIDASIDIFAGTSVKGIYNYTISNTTGQIMQSGTLDITHAGNYSIILKPVFSPGIYQLVLKNSTNSLQKTVLKK